MLQRSVTEMRKDLSGRPSWSLSGAAGQRGSSVVLTIFAMTLTQFFPYRVPLVFHCPAAPLPR
jgi:hypothetical protein